MALDKNLTQTINLTATGDQLLKPLEAFGKEIARVIRDLNKMSDTMSAGNHKSEDSLRKQVQLLQRLIGEASTLQNILTSSANKRKDALLGVVDETSMGKKVLSASKLRQELNQTTKASEALELRLGKLYQQFNKLGEAGQTIRKTDLEKAYNTEGAIGQLKKLERELALLDLRAQRQGGYKSVDGGKMREEIRKSYNEFLQIAQNPNIWLKNANNVTVLTEKVRALAQAEAQVAREATAAEVALRRSLLASINQTDANLRASLQRGAANFRFTNQEARNFNMMALGQQIDANMVKLKALQQMMSKALNPDSPRDVQTLERLQRAWDNITNKTAEALAMQKAYNALPEQRGKAINQYLFGDGGLAFAGRIGGAMLIVNAIGMVTNALSGAVTSAIAFEDAMARLQAISGSTDEQMVRLSASIREVAANSRYAVEEIAEAATTIAQAGFSGTETGQLLGDALMLAAGSGSTPSEAVDTLTSALGAFNLQATESRRVVDTLMAGLNESKLSIQQMQAAIQYAGATAKENNVQFNELVAIAGSLSNAGIRSGSTIGTGLRQLLVDLKTPTKEFKAELESLGLTMGQVDVKTLGLAQVVKNLTDAGFSAEQAYASFEVRAASAFLAFRNQLDSYDQMALSIAQSGAAMEANERAMDSLSAKWTKLVNILKEGASAGLEDLILILKMLVDGIVWVIESVDYLVNEMNILGVTIGDVLSLGDPFGKMLDQLSTLIYGAGKETERLTTKVQDAEEALASNRQTISSLDDAIQNLILREGTLRNNQIALQAETLTLTSRFEGLAAELGGVAKSYDDLLNAMTRYRNKAVELETQNQLDVAQTNRDLAGNANSRLNENTNKASGLISRPGMFGGLGSNLNNPAVFAAARYYSDRSSTNYRNLSPEALIDEQVVLKTILRDLRALKSEDSSVKQLIVLLEEREANLTTLADALAKAEIAENRVKVNRDRLSPKGKGRTSLITDATQRVEGGLSANRVKEGSGDAELRTVLRDLNQMVSNWERMKQRSTNQAEIANLENDIQAAQGLIAKVEREARIKLEEGADGDGPNGTIGNPREVTLGQPVRGARITSYAGRRKDPFTGKMKYHAGTDYGAASGKPVLAAEEGFVTFAAKKGGYGNLIIIDHGNGVETWYGHLKDGSMLVEMGSYVGKGDQIAAVGSTGRSTGPHLHFEVRQNNQAVDPRITNWKFRINPAQAAASGDKVNDQVERDIQQLQQARANSRVGGAKSRLNTIVTQAKGGALPPSQLNSDFEAASAEYLAAGLEQFDINNPMDGLTGAGLEARALARAEAEQKLREDIANFHAQLWNAVADAAGKDLELALKVAEDAFNQGVYDAEAPVRDVTMRGNMLQNRTNRTQYGAGTAYLQEREAEQVTLDADRKKVDLYGQRAFDITAAITTYDAEIASLEKGSEAYNQALAKRNEAERQLVDVLREKAALQQTINERTGQYTTIPLEQRLRGSAQAWLESSGAMDSWSKRAENAVAPTLDKLTQGFTEFFTSVLDGSKSFGQALKDMIGMFIEFVMQMIIQALALEAVKGILSLFGLSLPGAFNGGIVKKGPQIAYDTTGFYDGGLVPGLYNGGVTRMWGGGRVNRGTPLRDSAMYELAEGEYVVRNKSVRDIGVDNMEMINKHGAAGLAKVAGAGSMFTNIQAPKQETNVWIVQDKKEAGIGPNDVLVTVQNDILQNGVTKRLIKQVAQGA